MIKGTALADGFVYYPVLGKSGHTVPISPVSLEKCLSETQSICGAAITYMVFGVTLESSRFEVKQMFSVTLYMTSDTSFSFAWFPCDGVEQLGGGIHVLLPQGPKFNLQCHMTPQNITLCICTEPLD